MNYTTQLPVSLMEYMKVLMRIFFGLYPFAFFHAHIECTCFVIGIAIGGDVFPGSTLSDHVLRFNNIPQVNCFFFVLRDFIAHTVTTTEE